MLATEAGRGGAALAGTGRLPLRGFGLCVGPGENGCWAGEQRSCSVGGRQVLCRGNRCGAREGRCRAEYERLSNSEQGPGSSG